MAPEIRVFEEKLNALSTMFQEIKSSLASKETVANVDQVKVEIASMLPTLKQKADEAEVKRLNTHVQQIHSNMVAKADASVVEHLSQQYASLSSSSVTKGELASLSARLEQVSSKIDTNINNMQSTLNNYDFADMSRRLDSLSNGTVTPTQLKENLSPLKNMLDTLSITLSQKANSSDLSSLRTTLDDLQVAIKGKAEASIVEQLNIQYRQQNKALSQKAEFTEMEDLRSQIKNLASALEKNPFRGEIDALSLQLKGLTAGLASTIDEKVDLKVTNRYKLDTDKLTEFVNKSIAELKKSVADVETTMKTKATIVELEKVSKQVLVLVDAVAHTDCKLEDWQKQVTEFKKLISLKADDLRVDKLDKALENLSTQVTKHGGDFKTLSTSLEDCKKTLANKADNIKVDKLAEIKADKHVVDHLVKQMESVADTLARKSIDLDELQRRVQDALSLRGIKFDELEQRLAAVHDLQGILSKIDNLDTLSGQVDLLFNKMATKADNAVMDELLANLRGKAENTTVDQLATRVNNGMDSMSRRIRMLIEGLINSIRRNAIEPTRIRVGGGYLTENNDGDAPPDAELLNVLQQITAENLSPRVSPRATVPAFGTDSPPMSPRIVGSNTSNMDQIRRELDDVNSALSRKADKSALSTLSAEFQRLSDFTMTHVLQSPNSLPPGSLRPQSARGGPGSARPTTPRGARRPHFGPG